MVEQVNNNGQLINELIQVGEFVTEEENKALSETVDNLRKEADTAAIKTPKQIVKKNPESKVDILESGDQISSLFEDEAPAPKLRAAIQEPQKVIQEQKNTFIQKQESGELVKYDESAVALASQFIDSQFDEDVSVEDSLNAQGLLDLPEEEAANIIMQSAEILGDIETPDSDTKMNFIEDVDALLMSRDKDKPRPAKDKIGAASSLNQKIVTKQLKVSDDVLVQAKLEAQLEPKVIPENMSEFELEIQEEKKIEKIIDNGVASQIDSLKGELSVAEGVLGSEKSKLSGLGANVDTFIDQAIASSSVQNLVLNSTPKPGEGATVAKTSAKKTNKATKNTGFDNSGVIQRVTANISAVSGQVTSLGSQIAGLEAELET